MSTIKRQFEYFLQCGPHPHKVNVLFSSAQVYAVPPTQCQEPSYDIPVPSATEAQQQTVSGNHTLPKSTQGRLDLRCADVTREIGSHPRILLHHAFQKLLAGSSSLRQVHRKHITVAKPPPLYDIPKASSSSQQSLNCSSPPKVLPKVYEKLQTRRSSDWVYAVPSQEQVDHIPLECRGDPTNPYEHTRARLQRMRKGPGARLPPGPAKEQRLAASRGR